MRSYSSDDSLVDQYESQELTEEDVFIFPASFAQQRLWFLVQLEGASPTYNIFTALSIQGNLNVTALENSLIEIVNRHEILRTTFALIDGLTMQVVSPNVSVSLEKVDLQNLPEVEGLATVEKLALAEAQERLNLETGPLLRLILLKLSTTSHVLLLNMHHIISDGWSMTVLLRELSVLYTAFSQNLPSPLPELPIQYADFACWQREWLTSEQLTPQLNYWKKQLADAPPLLELPLDHPRPRVQSFRGELESFCLTPELSEQLQSLSQRLEVTLFMTLFAAFAVLLSRYSGQEDIVIGTPIANRNRREIEDLIGFFVNTLVLRTDLSSNPSFQDFLQQVKQIILGAYAHQDLPLEKLVEELKPERNLSYTPLFQVMFSFENTSETELNLPGLSLSSIPIESKTAKFDLTLVMQKTEEGLIGVWEYNRDLFERETIQRFRDHFQTLLEGIVANSKEKVAYLPLLTAREKEQILKEWNQTTCQYPTELLIHQLVAQQASLTPEAVAVVAENEHLSYSQLNQKANQLAHYLQHLGVKPETRVAICMERSLMMIVGLLAILKAGGAYLPIDPAYPQERIHYILEDAQVSIVLSQSHLREKLGTSCPQVINLDENEFNLEEYSRDNLNIEVNLEHLAYIIYTSGSTGQPKGVEILHRGLLNLVFWHQEAFKVTAEDRATQLAALAFDASVWEIWPYLSIGASLYLVKSELLLTPEKLRDWLLEQKISIAFLPTPLAQEILVLEWPKTSSLRILLTGGDQLHQYPSEDLPFQLVNNYGPTENTVVSTSGWVKPQPQGVKMPNIGRVIANTQVYLLDAYLQPVPIAVPGQICLSGVGLARGYLNRPELTAEKFVDNPFKELNTGIYADKLYLTGDRGRYLPNGEIEYLGRLDNQVKVRGFRIELGEIESLLREYPKIKEAAVIIKEEPNSQKRLVAYVVPQLPDRLPYHVSCSIEVDSQSFVAQTQDFSIGGVGLTEISQPLKVGKLMTLIVPLPGETRPQTLTAKVIWQQGKQAGVEFQETGIKQEILTRSCQELLKTGEIFKIEQQSLRSHLKDYLKTQLPNYMIPSAFVFLEALPLTPNGKIDRKALALYKEFEEDSGMNYIAPRTSTEKTLVEIWQKVLNKEAISIEDNFFELGGHSLLATQVISRVREAFKIEQPVRALFEFPTVAELAKTIDQEAENLAQVELLNINPISRSQDLPLSFAQERLWFLDQLEGESATYNILIALSLKGNLDQLALEKSLSEIVRRHEVFRTYFVEVVGVPVQRITPPIAVTIPIEDLSDLPSQEQQDYITELINTESNLPFDLTKSPLWRVKLVEKSSDSYVLLFSWHHIITDGWSTGIFLEELCCLYQNYIQGKPSDLRDLEIQYADFAHWQRQYLKGEILEQHLSYWRQQLTGIPPLLELPLDHPRPPIQTFEGKTESLTITTELTQKLQELSQQSGTTLFMTLLAVFSVLLYRYSSQEDIAIGTPIANRNRGEIESLIGFFVNTLVLRLNLSENPRFDHLLEQVKQVTLEAYAHQDVPFEKLVEELKPERSLSHTPLFQVMFAWQNIPDQNLELEGLDLTPLETESLITKFDLTLSMAERDGELVGEWEYNSHIFERETILRMSRHFQNLLAAVVEQHQEKIAHLSILTYQEEHLLLKEWNKTLEKYPAQPCVHQLFEQQVSQTPDAIALSFENQHLTYQQLNKQANQLAHYLQQLGVKPETLVGLCIERSLEMVIAILAILKAGGAYLPLDPVYPAERLAFMIQDSQSPIILTQSSLSEKLPQQGVKILELDHCRENLATYSRENPESGVTPEHLIYIIYTSGSTGKPKGVLINHYNVTRLFSATQPWYHFTNKDVWTLFHSYAFDFSVWEIWGALAYGGKLVIVPYGVSRSPEDFYRLLKQEKVTILNQTPSAFRQLIPVAVKEEESGELGLKWVIFGGEALDIPSLKPWFDHFGDEKPQLVNMYGITETTVHVTYRPLKKADLNSRGSVIGSAIPDLEIYILDQYQQLSPIGIAGEMYIGGAGLARGYLNREDLNEQKFIDNPFREVSGECLYRSGDLGRYLPNGEVEYLGRIDHQVKIRGFRIELGEIEDVLTQHPEVKEVVVIVRKDESALSQLVAYVVSKFIPERVPYHTRCLVTVENTTLKLETEDISVNGLGIKGELALLTEGQPLTVTFNLPGEAHERWFKGKIAWIKGQRGGITLDLDDLEKVYIEKIYHNWLKNGDLWKVQQRALATTLRDYLKDKLPDYMIPNAFVLLEALPLTPNGKIDRKALPTPNRDDNMGDTALAPRDLVELKLAQIWSEVLKVHPIGLKDNFFELGGHSLLAVRLMALIRQQFGQSLPVATLFQTPTIEQLASLLRKEKSSLSLRESLIPIQSQGSKPPLFCVHPAGGTVLCYYDLACYLGTEQPFYGLQSRNLDVHFPPLTSIEAMAEYYIEGIRDRQPQGPYYLLGWSMGGLIAMEMAKKLRLQGERVAFVGLLDTYVPSLLPSESEDDVSILMMLLGEKCSISEENFRQLSQDQQLHYVLEQAQQWDLFPSDIGIEEIQLILKVQKIDRQAVRGYIPQLYEGKITLFRAQENAEVVTCDPFLGWSTLVSESVNLSWVPGDHENMVYKPHVQVLAQELKRALEEIQQF